MAFTRMVFVMFADRAAAFSNGRAVDWNEVQQAITLATYSYFNKTGGLTNPDVPPITNDANNPFYAYQNAGLEVRIPRITIADTPSGNVLNRLMTEIGR